MKIEAPFNASGGRFVLLWHELPATQLLTSHWDFMVETADLLLTFRLDRLPQDGTTAILAERLSDHRQRYLDFEGELSNDRGHVRRVAKGNYQLVDSANNLLILALNSTWFTGQMQFQFCDVGEMTKLEFHRRSPISTPLN
ncbi:MAG: hypothetical protein R3C53_25945 [Pirellulaceae bacterium]